MATIAFTNQKGGVGKTTSAVCVAAELAAAGHPTLLVDLDPQGNATSGLGIRETDAGTSDVLLGDASLREAAVPTKLPGLSVLAGTVDLAGAEAELANAEGRYVRLERALSGHHYTYVILDCPPALGFLSLNALVAADSVVIPVQCEYFALEGLSRLFEILRKVKGSLNERLELLGVVITMYDSRLRLADSVVAEVRKHFPDKTFETLIPRNVRVAEAPSFGEPVVTLDPTSSGGQAYKSLTQEVLHATEARTRARA
jgi:chromosome partitioning protein